MIAGGCPSHVQVDREARLPAGDAGDHALKVDQMSRSICELAAEVWGRACEPESSDACCGDLDGKCHGFGRASSLRRAGGFMRHPE